MTHVLDLPEYQAAIKKVSPRPSSWDAIIGNHRTVEILREALAAAKAQDKPLDHVLLFGPPGVGKTTLSLLCAQEQGGHHFTTLASTLTSPTEVLRYLVPMCNYKELTGHASTIFLDEIHLLGRSGSLKPEAFYPLLEEWKFPHNVGGKEFITYAQHEAYTPRRDSNVFFVWPFTCIGATTEPGLLPPPLLDRFPIKIQMDPYTNDDIAAIVLGSATRLGYGLTPEAAQEIARYGRGTPRRANELLLQARNRTRRDLVTIEDVQAIIQRLRLFPLGLTETDLQALRFLAERGDRGLGQEQLAKALGIALSQYSGIVESYLRFLGFIDITQGRVITPRGRDYLKSVTGGAA